MMKRLMVSIAKFHNDGELKQKHVEELNQNHGEEKKIAGDEQNRNDAGLEEGQEAHRRGKRSGDGGAPGLRKKVRLI